MIRKSNDLSTINVGTRLWHKTVQGRAPAPVVIVGIDGDRYIYKNESTGHTDSSRSKGLRQGSRFWPRPEASVRPTPVLVVPEGIHVVLAPEPPKVEPPPIVMNSDGATVTFEGHTIHVYVFRGRPCVVAKDLGRALGYSDDGKKLVDSIADWAEMKSPEDFELLEFGKLHEFKKIAALTSGAGVSQKARSLTVLYETGMDLACQKAQTPAGDHLRRYIAERVLPRLRRGEPVTPTTTPTPALDPRVDGLISAMTQLTATVGALVIRMAATPSRAPAPELAAPGDLKPTKYLSPSSIAARLTVALQQSISAQRVGLAINALGFRYRQDLYEIKLVQRAHSEGDAAGYLWAPSVYETLLDYFKNALPQKSVAG